MNTFDPATHTYQIGGKPVPSVTTVLRRVLPTWKASEWHMHRGTATHHGCHLLDQGRLDWSTVDAAILPRLRAWEKFRNDWPAKMVASELPMYSQARQFAGTVDRVFLWENNVYICDLKNSVTPVVGVQMAAYAALWNENGSSEGRAVKAVAVELREDGSYSAEWYVRSELDRLERVFLAAITVYGFMEKHNLKGVP